jgi:hypothetical protein
MSKPVVAFTTQGNWTAVYNESRAALETTPGNFTPIPAFEIGFLFTEHILAIRAFSNNAKPTWKYAGSIYQRLQLGAGGALSDLPEVDLSSRGVYLRRTMLLDFPRYTAEYGLLFVPPPWMLSLQLTLWQYSGVDSDNVTELLTTAKADLVRIESKIDSLAAAP